MPCVARASRNAKRLAALDGRTGIALRALPCYGAGVVALLRLVLASVLAFGLSACTPSIGDACAYATECSARGDRMCDLTQPGGYCTIANCSRGTCPAGSLCVLFGATEPGCPTNDRATSRFGRTYCMAMCGSGGDCRAGYRCDSPVAVPWAGMVLDDDGAAHVCLAEPNMSLTRDGGSSVDAAVPGVCSTVPPELPALGDAGVRRADAAAP